MITMLRAEVERIHDDYQDCCEQLKEVKARLAVLEQK